MHGASATPRWLELQRLFDGALELSATYRAAWLESQTDDAEVRAEVRKLIAHHAATGRPAAEFQRDAALIGAVAADAAGAYGQWTLLSLAGHGGMGSVYLAERRFHGGTQRAALKVSHALLADAESA